MKKTASILKFGLVIFGLMLSASLFTSCGDDDVEGCTNQAADNYNPDATVDDNSCVISGCTDQDAENYDPSATSDDGSCEFARDKFLGSYLGSLACPLPPDGFLGTVVNNDMLPFDIVVDNLINPTDKSSVLIALNGTIPVTFAGTASGNTITLATTLPGLPLDLDGDMIPESVTLEVGGAISLAGSDVAGTVSIQVTAPIMLPAESCDIAGVRQ